MLIFPMLRCYITDRYALAPGVSLLETIAHANADWVQIREKDLSPRALFDVVKAAIPLGKKVIVNSRMDVALAAGAAGLHLPAGSIPPDRWRAISPRDFLIGVSCHTIGEVRRAAEHGADYVFFGPIFAPLSKSSSLAPRGLAGLRHAARSVRIPVFALGGITRDNADRCAEQGAAGIAAISLYQC